MNQKSSVVQILNSVPQVLTSDNSPDAPDPEFIAQTRYETNLPGNGPELSDRAIAARLHVSHATVASVRRDKCGTRADPPASTLNESISA